ncbi:MAG: lamin tail domain-containing protein [Patescibacteria group bacterium]
MKYKLMRSFDFGRLRRPSLKMTARMFLLGVLFLMPAAGLAYETSTHQHLTEAAVDFFNNQGEQNITIDLEELLIQGSVEEDSSFRFLNHFFDPIYNRGLEIASFSGASAKQWAQDEGAQLSFGHKPFFNKITSFISSTFSSDLDDELNFTWQAALRRYKDGDEEGAMLALGHVLHLFQDISVPAHTRNDSHFYSSPYENFSKYKQAREWPVNDLVRLSSLDDYFDGLAEYSNSNFYSRDTIGLGKYSLPETDYFELKDGYYYGVKNDEFGNYYLFRKSGGNMVFANRNNVSIDTPVVLQGYWDRLSDKAVIYGAGIIDLFFKEVEGALPVIPSVSEGSYKDSSAAATPQNDEEEENNRADVVENVLALINRANKILDGMEKDPSALPQDDTEGVGGVSLEVDDDSDNYNANNSPAGTFIPIIPAGDSVILNDSEESLEDPSLLAQDDLVVFITEFLFDAEGADTGKEFIELYNPNDQEVDLYGWSIQTTGGKKNFEEGNVIGPKSFFLIWLGASSNADMEWKSGSLKNSMDTIYLVRNTEVIDSDGDPDIVDMATYNKDDFIGFEPGYSLERIVSSDGTVADEFKIQTQPSPGALGNVGTLLASVDPGSESGMTEQPLFQWLNFYRDPNNSQRSIVDIKLNNPAFSADWSEAWKVLIFYGDCQPANQDFISTSDDWTPATDGLLTTTYPIYVGNTKRQSLILPTAPDGYGSSGGIKNQAYNYSLIEDGIVRFYIEDDVEYLTMAVYDFYQSGGGQQSFRLKVIDSEKYYWQEDAPNYQPPMLTGDLSFNFDKQNSLLVIDWPDASDADSRDQLLVYDVKINGEVVELAASGYQINVSPGDTVAVEARAKDEFSNYSNALAGEWSYPEPELVINQDQADGWSGNIGNKNPNCSSCPGTASLQSVTLPQTAEIDFVNLKIWQSAGGWPANLRLSIYDDNGSNYPDFNNLVTTTTLSLRLDSDPDDVTNFTFGNSVTLGKNRKYWLALDVESYSNHKAFYQSKIQNAIYGAENVYNNGMAGMGHSGECFSGGYCTIHVPYPSASADWWMRMGLTQ